MHGKDINFANKYVSLKLINLLTGVLDWLDDKEKEERLEELRKREDLESKSLREILDDITDFSIKRIRNKQYISNWEQEKIVFTDDKSKSDNHNVIILPRIGKLEDYK